MNKDEIEASVASMQETTKRMVDNIEANIQELIVEIQELKVEIEILSPSSHDEIQELESDILELEGLKAEYEESKAELEESLIETQTVLNEEYTHESLNASSTSSTILNMVGAGASWVGKKTWAGVKKSSKYAWDHKVEWFEKVLEKQEKRETEAFKKRDSVFERVQNQNEETVLRNYERLKRDHKAGETLSAADMLYIKAAREKLNL